MLAAQSAVQDINSIRLLLVIAAVLVVLFWRIALKMVIMVVLIVLVVLITSGAVAFVEGFQHLIK